MFPIHLRGAGGGGKVTSSRDSAIQEVSVPGNLGDFLQSSPTLFMAPRLNLWTDVNSTTAWVIKQSAVEVNDTVTVTTACSFVKGKQNKKTVF